MAKGKFKFRWYHYLLAFGLLLFIPDPLDFLFGIGVVLEAIALVFGGYYTFKEAK